MRNLNDKVVALTGAGSGIGRALAITLANEGASLALSDVNRRGLEETIAAIETSRLVSSAVIDVSDKEAVESWALDVVKDHGHVDAIINNAGVSAKGSVENISYEDMHWVMNINLWGVVHGVKAFLPHLKKRPEAVIVNIASLNSFVPFPLNAPYNMAKCAIGGLSETLMQELRKTSIRVTCVFPGGIKTGIVENARNSTAKEAKDFSQIAKTTPEQAAHVIVRGMKRKKRRVFVGADAKLLTFAKRMLPMTTVWAFGRWFEPKTKKYG